MKILKKYKKGELRLDEFQAAGYKVEVHDIWYSFEYAEDFTVEEVDLKALNGNEDGKNSTRVLIKSAALDRIIAKRSKKALHDVISLTKGRWGSSLDAARLTNDARQIIYMDTPCFSSDYIFSKQEHDDYIAEIAADYASYKDEFEVVGKVSKAQSALGCGDKPVFTQAMKDAGELPPVGSEVALIEDAGFYSPQHCTTYTGNSGDTAFVIGHANRPDSGAPLVTLMRKVGDGFLTINPSFIKPIKSQEEKLVDDIKQLIDDAHGLDSKILAGALCTKYNITLK